MGFYQPIDASATFAGKTLIIPVVSAANVSQLAVDLLIESSALTRVGVFDPRDIIPLVGSSEDGNSIIMALELYANESLPIAVIQQRSPALKDRKNQYVNSVIEWAKDAKFASILFLAGIDLSERTDSQMTVPTHYILPSGAPQLTIPPLSNIFQLPIPPYTSPVTGNMGELPFLPGGGLTRRFLAAVGTSLPCSGLVHFVLEGDNRADALLLASVVAKVLGLQLTTDAWKEPQTWQSGLFGGVPEQTLYG